MSNASNVVKLKTGYAPPLSLVMIATQLCLEALKQAVKSRRTGQTHFFDAWPVDQDLMTELDAIDIQEAEEVCKLYASRLMDKGGNASQIDLNVITRMLKSRREEVERMDEFLNRGASNGLMKELFDVGFNFCSSRRRLLGIAASKGRTSNPKSDLDILYAWDDISQTERCERKRYLYVQQVTGVSLDVIYRVMQLSEQTRIPIDTSGYTNLKKRRSAA